MTLIGRYVEHVTARHCCSPFLSTTLETGACEGSGDDVVNFKAFSFVLGFFWKLIGTTLLREDAWLVGSTDERYGYRDSLAAVELRNWFVRSLEANVGVMEILAGKSIEALAGDVVGVSLLVRLRRRTSEEDERDV